MQFIKSYFYYKSHKNLYQVLQVMHTTPERAIKSRKNYHSFVDIVTCAVTCDSTDRNKLVIFSGIRSFVLW